MSKTLRPLHCRLYRLEAVNTNRYLKVENVFAVTNNIETEILFCYVIVLHP